MNPAGTKMGREQGGQTRGRGLLHPSGLKIRVNREGELGEGNWGEQEGRRATRGVEIRVNGEQREAIPPPGVKIRVNREGGEAVPPPGVETMANEGSGGVSPPPGVKMGGERHPPGVEVKANKGAEGFPHLSWKRN